MLDGLVLLATAGLGWLVPLFLPGGEAELNPLAGTAGFVVVGIAMLVGRRIEVRLALAGVVAVALAAYALAAPGTLATADDPVNLLMPMAPAFPVYAGHVYARDRRRAWLVAAAAVLVAVHPWASSVPTAASGLLYVGTPMLYGFYLTARQQLVRTLTDRAESAERERDEQPGRARTEERVRMATELHDIVTHRVSLMVLHAGALRITATDSATRDAAEYARATGCGALDELRDLIGVLREPGQAVRERVPEPAAERPVPPVDRSDYRVGAAALGWTALLTVAVLAGNADQPVSWLAIALQLPAAAVLVLRRRHPHLAAAVTGVVSLVLLGLSLAGPAPPLATSDVTTLLVPAAAPLATYAVGAYSRRPALAAAAVLVLVALAARPWAPYAQVVTVAVAFVGVPALLGLYVGARRRLVAALLDRAERAEREQRLLVERARAEERGRLAGEMREIVAGGVRDMLDRAHRLRATAPAPATRDAAAELIATGTRALDELHDLVAALRAGPATAEPADLGTLAAESTSVGVPVELVERGDPAVLSPAVLRTTRRVVAEALTNVRKHAHGAHVRVRVSYARDEVRVDVRNGPAAPHPRLRATGSGTGLLGLRQRVELIEGTLSAGPTADGGFAVGAILPAYVPTTKEPT